METTEDLVERVEEEKVVTRTASKLSGMQLTERDLTILHFINNFGFCEMPQIETRFSLTKRRSYQIMERLLTAGLIKHERVFHGRHGVYRLSKKGATYTDLPALTRITLAHYNHSLAVLDVYLYLRRKYPEAQWLSERHLIHEKYCDGVGKRGHLPDGILLVQGEDNKEHKIAIEVELRLKSKGRIEKILKWYTTQFDFAEVWYFCPQGIAAFLQSVVGETMPFVKVRSLKEIL